MFELDNGINEDIYIIGIASKIFLIELVFERFKNIIHYL